MRAFLVMAYDNPAGQTHRVVRPVRRLGDCSDSRVIRVAMEQTFPHAVIASPLDPFPAGGYRVIVWGSTEPDGGSRSGGNFQEWAVGPLTEAP